MIPKAVGCCNDYAIYFNEEYTASEASNRNKVTNPPVRGNSRALCCVQRRTKPVSLERIGNSRAIQY